MQVIHKWRENSPRKSGLGITTDHDVMMTWLRGCVDEPMCVHLLQMQNKVGLMWVGGETCICFLDYLHNVKGERTYFFCPGYTNYIYLETSIQQIFIECLLYARHCARFWECTQYDRADRRKDNNAFELHKQVRLFTRSLHSLHSTRAQPGSTTLLVLWSLKIMTVTIQNQSA